MSFFNTSRPPSPIGEVQLKMETDHSVSNDDLPTAPLTSTRVDEDVDVMDGRHENEAPVEDGIDSMNAADILRRASSIKSLLIKKKKLSREAFFVQAGLIYIISIACIVNLSIGTGPINVWVALLSGCLGYLLPEPKIRREKIRRVIDLPKDNAS